MVGENIFQTDVVVNSIHYVYVAWHRTDKNGLSGTTTVPEIMAQGKNYFIFILHRHIWTTRHWIINVRVIILLN